MRNILLSLFLFFSPRVESSVDFQKLKCGLENKFHSVIDEDSEMKNLFYKELTFKGQIFMGLLEKKLDSNSEVEAYLEKFRQEHNNLWENVSNAQAVHMNLLSHKTRLYYELAYLKRNLGITVGSALIAFFGFIKADGKSIARFMLTAPSVLTFSWGAAVSLISIYDCLTNESGRWQRLINELKIKDVTFDARKKATITDFIKKYALLNQHESQELCDQYLKVQSVASQDSAC